MNNEVPQCSVCNQSFHSQQELDEHNRQRHGQGRMTDEGQAGSGRVTEGQFGRGSTPAGGRDFESGTDPHAGRNQEQERKSPTTVNNQPEQEQDQPVRKKRAAR